MSRSTLYKQNYCCSQCQKEQKHYVWSDKVEETEHKCTECQTTITHHDVVYEEEIEGPKPLVKMTKQQIKQDRRIRSSQHFQKEILPYLPKQERQHHSKKLGKNFL